MSDEAKDGDIEVFFFDKRDLEVYLPVNRRTIRSTGQRNAFKWTGTARVIFNLCSIASPLPGAPPMTSSPSPQSPPCCRFLPATFHPPPLWSMAPLPPFFRPTLPNQVATRNSHRQRRDWVWTRGCGDRPITRVWA